jgi:Ca-activated chloride channel homolog
MSCFSISAWIIALTLVVAGMNGASAAEPDEGPRTEDAMIVFDASGSMSGDGWGYGSESAGSVSRIDKVRTAMREILPSVTRFRRVGLITDGSGAWNQCTIRLDLKPRPNAADRIIAAIDALRPAGRTPLTDAVAQGGRYARLPPQASSYRRPYRRRGLAEARLAISPRGFMPKQTS